LNDKISITLQEARTSKIKSCGYSLSTRVEGRLLNETLERPPKVQAKYKNNRILKFKP